MVKTNKNYFSDTYMFCRILGVDLNNIQQKDPILFGHNSWKFCCYRIGKNTILKNNGDLFGIEVKFSSSLSLNNFKGLKTLKVLALDYFKCSVVLYAVSNTVQFATDIFAVPIVSI